MKARFEFPTLRTEEQGLLSWAVVQLQRIVDVVNTNSDLLQEVRSTAPTKGQVGQLYYADGVGWNPGAGEGTYEFRSDGNFYKLGA